VELNPQMIDLVRRRFGSYAGEIYRDRRVRVVSGEGRRFISDSTGRFDLIQIALVDSFAGSAAGRSRAGGELSLHGRVSRPTCSLICVTAAIWSSPAGRRCLRGTS